MPVIRKVITSITLAVLLSSLVLLSLALAATPLSLSPRSSAAGNAAVSVSYDEPIQAASVSAATFPVYSRLRGRLAGTYSVSGGTVSFDPAGFFLPGEELAAIATSGVRTITGAATSAYGWQFTAAAAPGPGTFVVSRTVTPGAASTQAIALGDVNGDGCVDAAVGNFELPTQQNVVYLNTCAGQFSGGTRNFGSGVDKTQALVLADMDRDGSLDAVVGNSSGQPNIIYLNDGAGNFSAGLRIFGLDTDDIIALAAADLNNDGWLDLVAARQGQASAVYLSASGFFGPGTAIGAAAWNTAAIDAGDFDNDGDVDLALGNASTTYRNVILKNDGAGNFTTTYPFGAAEDARAIKFLDANRDGWLDVAVGNYGRQNRVYLNNGAGGLQAGSLDFGTGTDHTVALATGDFNGDNYPDIATANRAQQSRVYFYDAALGYTNDANFGPADSLALSLAVADLDNDGDLDLAMGNYNQPSAAYLNGGFDHFAPTVSKTGVVEGLYTAGHVVTWTITARQNGPAADMYLTDPLGPYFDYLTHTATAALTVTSTTPFFRATWPKAALGETLTLTLVTRLNGTPAATPTNTVSFTNTGYLTPTTTAPTSPDCGDQPCRYYPAGVQPALSKSGVSAAPYTAGSVVTWTITATNQGAVDDFFISDPVGPDFAYVSHTATPPLAETFTTSPTFRARWSAVGANQTVTLTLVTTLAGSASSLTPTNTAALTTTAYLTPTITSPAQPLCGAQACPFAERGVELTPSAQNKVGGPGQVLIYNFTLTNPGTLPDVYQVDSSATWNATLTPAAPVSLTGDSSQALTLSVTIPTGTVSGTVVSHYLTATSQAAWATAGATTTVGFDRGQGIVLEPLTLTPPPLFGAAGTPITLTHLITNTANTTGSVTLAVGLPAGWPGPAQLLPTLPLTLGPGLTASVTIVVMAPISATLSPSHTVTIIAADSFTTTPTSVLDTLTLTPDPNGDADGDGVRNWYESQDGNYNNDDTDGDGLPNYLDPDDDGDGVWTKYEYPDHNGDDNPADALDTDGDGIPDYLDNNDDNDGRLTRDEAADPNGDGNPFDALDNDGDSIPNYLDADDGYGPDADNDGLSDAVECPGGSLCPDSDHDGIPDYLDTDSDNDGLLDEYEYDKNGDGVADDTDGDGLPDYRDPDDDGDGISTINEQPDPNGDGHPSDALDSDGDGIPDYLDRSAGAGGGDSDQDGIPDAVECPGGSGICVDSDHDGIPDYMDTDSDNDRVLDRWEYDRNGDGVADDTDRDGLADYRDPDDDGDGTPTLAEQADPNGDGNPSDAVDADHNGLPDYLDPGQLPDADDDGIPNLIECPSTPCRDSDGDGLPDYLDADSDNDGVPDRYECPNGLVCRDTDGDGAPDYRDFDDDGDGTPTLLEQPDPNGDGSPADALDSDHDGIPDYLDPDSAGGPQGGDSDRDGVPDTAECPGGSNPATPAGGSVEGGCPDSDGDAIPDYMDPTDSAGARLYLALRENGVIAWHGILTGPLAVTLPAAPITTGLTLTYTLSLSNTGGLTTTAGLTATFTAGLAPANQVVSQTGLPPGGGWSMVYSRQVVATTTMTLTIRFELTIISGTQTITAQKTLHDDHGGIYLPLILKGG